IGLPNITGNFDISKFNRSKSIKFPILTDPIQALYLVLGKEDVTLATLETPSLTGRGSLKTSTGIFQSWKDKLPGWVEELISSVGNFKANVDANFNVHAGLGFGFDTAGLFRWGQTDFDPERADLILDGFFVSDRENPDGTGKDIRELDFGLNVGIGLEAGSLLSVSGRGQFGGDLSVDLKDPNGDGKVRFYSEVLPQLNSLNRLVSGRGSVTASGSASLKFKIKYPSIPDVWNLNTWETTLYNLKLPTTTLAKLSVGDRGISVGTAFDGPVEGSWVFFDANFNGIHDRFEPSTITFSEGDYDLEIPLDEFDRNGDGKIDLTEGQIVVADGTDTDTFQKQRFPFFTAPEWTVASPLTALALRLAQPNLDATEASLETAFALPTGFNLQADDPFATIENGDRNGVAVLAAQGQLQNLIILGANALGGDLNAAANAIVAQVSQVVRSGDAVNLADATQVAALLNAAAIAVEASGDLSATIEDIQRRNQAIVEASSAPLDKVREAIVTNIALESIDESYFSIAVEPWAVLLRTSQPVPPLAAASARVLDLLDLPNIVLGEFDPFANLNSSQGVAVLTRQIQINATLVQIADIAIGAGVDDAETKVFDALVSSIASGVQLEDLSQPDIVLSLLRSVAFPGAAARMAEIIAASNANFSAIATAAIESGNFETVRDDLVELQIIVQYLQAQLLQSVAAGKITIDQFDRLMEFNLANPNLTTIFENIIEGTDGDDTLVGTAINDWIAGRGGNDLIQANEGDDIAYGNQGQDTLDGGNGDDILSAGQDDDLILTGNGNNYAFGNKGNDRIEGGEEIDNLHGGQDNDTVLGNAGDDWLLGEKGDDVVDGGDGNDVIVGGQGLDSLQGSGGDDLIFGNVENDTLDGGIGNDTLSAGKDDDWVLGNAGDDVLFGNIGNDILDGGEGNDTLAAGQDSDRVFGNAGDDLLFGNIGNDVLDGSDGNDSVLGGQDDDQLFGNAGDDALFGNLGNDVLDGGDGNDYLGGGQNNDSLTGGLGDDTLSGDLGDDSLTGGGGSDRFVLVLDSGNDVIADFTDGIDLLAVSPDLLADIQQRPEIAIDTAEGAKIELGSGSVLMPGVSAGAIDVSDFVSLI
ncbi:MAG: calcium-binding protein, partial [Geitlerinemataceae cyanobacterium]